jgi:hypothetical protein
MALLNVSDPGQQVVDALSRLSHDADTEVRRQLCSGVAEALWGLFKSSGGRG